jgi:hypothetical protein
MCPALESLPRIPLLHGVEGQVQKTRLPPQHRCGELEPTAVVQETAGLMKVKIEKLNSKNRV